jgi:Ca2+-binding RTX toxin-like protein
MRGIAVLSGVAVAALATAAPAVAGTLDQSQELGSGTSLINNEFSKAQTYTAGLSGAQDQVDLRLSRNAEASCTGELRLEIQAAANGPSGAALDSVPIAPSSIPAGTLADPNFAWISVRSGSPPIVSAGTQYAIVLTSTGGCGNPNFNFLWASASQDPYPRGQFFSRLATDSSWSGSPDADHTFRTFVAPVAATASCSRRDATIVGTTENDDLTGTPSADVIAGLGGRDSIAGLGGRDVLCGGPGKDRLRGGRGKDRLLGQGGKDKLKGGRGKDVCKGGKGADSGSCEVEKSV